MARSLHNLLNAIALTLILVSDRTFYDPIILCDRILQHINNSTL
ncbi:MAG: hypothetical protein V7K77_27170 [Nostoc sp.]